MDRGAVHHRTAMRRRSGVDRRAVQDIDAKMAQAGHGVLYTNHSGHAGSGAHVPDVFWTPGHRLVGVAAIGGVGIPVRVCLGLPGRKLARRHSVRSASPMGGSRMPGPVAHAKDDEGRPAPGDKNRHAAHRGIHGPDNKEHVLGLGRGIHRTGKGRANRQ